MSGNLIAIIVILVLLLVLAGIIYYAYCNIRKKLRDTSRMLFGTDSMIEGMKQREKEVEMTPKSVSSATNLYMPSIMRDFPEFHYDEMKSRAENVLTSYLQSITKQNPALLQGKWRFQMFFLSGAELSSYYSIFQAAFTCCYPIPIGSCVSQRMQQLTKFSFTPTPAEQIQLHRELTDMFVELMLSALSVSRDVKPIPAYLLSMKADFEENYAENHSLEYFEQALGISRYRLCREFSAAFHISPLQYLQEKKIEAAISLLLSTDDPIHEVGSAVGIDNTNHFIHLFKKHTGVTPFVYRQNAPQSIRETRCPSVPGGLPPQ
jgi:AraC-like DNA-binding protein/cbb3-type cytochrome oxidase subunit 3